MSFEYKSEYRTWAFTSLTLTRAAYDDLIIGIGRRQLNVTLLIQ